MIKKSITCLAYLGQCLIISCRASSHVCIDYTKKQKKTQKTKNKTRQKRNHIQAFLLSNKNKFRSYVHECMNMLEIPFFILKKKSIHIILTMKDITLLNSTIT